MSECKDGTVQLTQIRAGTRKWIRKMKTVKGRYGTTLSAPMFALQDSRRKRQRDRPEKLVEEKVVWKLPKRGERNEFPDLRSPESNS